jgi:hypothetical protein
MLENKINMLEEKISQPINNTEDLNIQLPILTLEDLQLFEKELDQESFKNQVVKYLISATHNNVTCQILL